MDHERQQNFDRAIKHALLALRFIVGNYRVCPVCFCDAVASQMLEIATNYEHNEEVQPMTKDELAAAILALTEAKGSA